MTDEDEKLRHISRLGHELRNALTSVLAAAEVVKRRCGSDVDVETEYEIVTRQVGRMRQLVDEMLEITGRK